jgi:hypothetical protein
MPRAPTGHHRSRRASGALHQPDGTCQPRLSRRTCRLLPGGAAWPAISRSRRAAAAEAALMLGAWGGDFLWLTRSLSERYRANRRGGS